MDQHRDPTVWVLLGIRVVRGRVVHEWRLRFPRYPL